MKWLIRRCKTCGDYTLEDVCRKCGGETFLSHPPKFSPDDKYSLYKHTRERE
ncbi:RNA-protein complex protein Nop10 [[Eubacterium] cellulosolvens]